NNVNTFHVFDAFTHIAPVFFLMILRSPTSTLFPYTTLFRSYARLLHGLEYDVALGMRHRLRAAENVFDLASQAQQPIDHHVQRRSEEHTSELQSRGHLVCRLLLEKKKEFL